MCWKKVEKWQLVRVRMRVAWFEYHFANTLVSGSLAGQLTPREENQETKKMETRDDRNQEGKDVWVAIRRRYHMREATQ